MTLHAKLLRKIILKQELRMLSKKLHYHRKVFKQASVIHQFPFNIQVLYWKCERKTLSLRKPLLKKILNHLNIKIWNGKRNCHQDVVWMNKVKKEYYTNVIHKTYTTSPKIFTTAEGKLHNRKAPGIDLAVGNWYKLTINRKSLIFILQRTVKSHIYY